MDIHLELNKNPGKNNKSMRRKYFTKLLTILMCSNLLASVPCNSFPKIFGANAGYAYLSQIDVNGDYLAMGGDTNDNTLTGSTSYLPYVAMMSVSTGSYFYWAKAFSAKPSQSIAGLQFSTDGVLLIAHSGYLSSAFIVVLNSATGAIVTSRGYSTASYQNYDKRIKSILVGSGAAPMAYVLSKFQTSLTCSSQHFLKFDPLIFSATPVWAKKTLSSTTLDDCSNLGLAFGRGENFLYAFSWYNSKSTISLLDSNGLSYWQYSSAGGDYEYNNLIYYKAVDASTDMIIATSGYSLINYNRIISSSASPYLTQTGSQTYKDPTSSLDLEIRALYIGSLTSAKSLIYDITNKWTYLASIDFSTSPAKITYKKTLPLMDIGGLTTGVFVTDTIYYAGSYGDWFYQSQSSTYQYLNTNYWYQSVVYTSDMTLSTCYSLSTAASLTPVSMTTSVLSAITATIYKASTVTFVADTAASTTVNIVQTKVTKVTWCSQTAFTVIPVTQAKTTFSFNTNVAVQNLGITLFSATTGCGTYSNVWTYTGINSLTGLALNPATDLISVDPNFGTIQVQMTKPAGIYYVKVLGTLPDLKTTDSYVFTINIGSGGNQMPYFNSPLPDVSVPLKGGSVPYPFPAMTDPDAGDTPLISVIQDQATGTLPVFMTFGNPLLINPTLMTQVKAYTMIVIITDTKITSTYQFILTVTNLAPVVTSTIPTTLPLTFGQDLTYNLPVSSDPEALPYTTTILSGPSYATILSNTQAKLFPSNCRTDLGDIDLYIKLQDEEPKSFIYSINLKVTNQPPVFSGGLPQNQTMMFNTIFAYTLPQYQDPEGCPVVLTYQPTTLSSFVSVSGNQIIFQPKQLFQVGNFDIMVILTDYQGLSINVTFGITIYQPPQFVGSVVKQIELFASNEAYYSLPVMTGIADEYVVHEQSLPRFAQFSFPDYTFLPNRVSDLGVYTIKGQLWNSYTYISFQFRLNVTNEAPYIVGNQIPDQIVVALNTIEYYLLPSALDREGQPLTYLTYQTKKSSLPAFVKFNISSKEFTIAPNSLDIVDRYPITIDIIDTMNAISTYSFEISLYDTSSFLQVKQNITTTQTLMKNVSLPKANLNKNEVQLFFLKIVIVKVSREQEATLKIQSSENLNGGVSDIVKQITNNSMSISVNQKNNTYTIPYSIISKDTTTYQIKIGLKYPNPRNLSNTQVMIQRMFNSINRFLTKFRQSIYRGFKFCKNRSRL